MNTRLPPNKLRIVFMGTPEFAVASLHGLMKADYTIAGVVTAPDKPAGRGRKLQESAVKQFAIRQQLPLLQPTNLKDEGFLQELRALKANLYVVVAFRMLPRVVWQLPQYGTFNLHASLLPQYRGAAPIAWAIINGETQTGVTTFFIDEQIDTGSIILQQRAEITPTDTAGTLHDRLMQLGAELVVETCQHIAARSVTQSAQKQAEGLQFAPKLHKETCRIDWTVPLHTIYNHIRGLSPYPAAWTWLIDKGTEARIKIYKTSMEHAEHDYKIGALVVEKKVLKVAVHGGFLHLLEVQWPGKRKMKIAEVLPGLRLNKMAYLC